MFTCFLDSREHSASGHFPTVNDSSLRIVGRMTIRPATGLQRDNRRTWCQSRTEACRLPLLARCLWTVEIACSDGLTAWQTA